MINIDSEYIVVGCGLSGCVIARYIAEELNKKVTIIDRRNHIGGNMYDYVDEHGILIHKYGPHTFHTKEKRLYDYMCRFSDWQDYKLHCMAKIDGKFTPTPFNFKTIDDFYSRKAADNLKNDIKNYFGDRETATVVELLECEITSIREFAEFLFEKDYSLYTAKQWGIHASKVDKSILKRVPIRFSYDIGYFDDEYQVMPKVSYVEFFENLLSHKNIEVMLNVEALNHIKVSDNEDSILIDGKSTNSKIIYTGALDELFNLSDGALPYRSLRFDFKYEDIDSFQDAPVVAYPQEKDYTRITEYKKLPAQNVRGTSYAVEYSLKYEFGKEMEPYYPVLTQESMKQYQIYRKKADKIENLYCCGRLADFKYYNMDQALKRALDLCDKLK